jgi:hypothetical protein
VGIGELRGAGVPVRAIPRTGTVSLPCGIATVTVDGQRYGLRATADRAAIDAGRPIRLRGCGRLALPARDVILVGSSTARDASVAGPGPATEVRRAPALRVDGLKLTSPAPDPIARAAVLDGGRVLDAGREDHGGRTGVKVDVQGPSWLVLGQSFDPGWRATCDGRDLGAPQVLQGYANAWPVDRGCRSVTFAYAAQRVADGGYLVSGLACAALLALLAAGAYRRRRRAAVATAGPPPDPAPFPEPPAAHGVPLPAAIAVALPAAAAVAVCFGLRAGAVAAPLLALLLWRGVGDRALGWAIAALMGVVVPAIYVGVAVLGGADILGGNSTQYGADRLGAHWVAVAALVLMVVVLWRTLAAARVGRRAPDPGRDPVPSRR